MSSPGALYCVESSLPNINNVWRLYFYRNPMDSNACPSISKWNRKSWQKNWPAKIFIFGTWEKAQCWSIVVKTTVIKTLFFSHTTSRWSHGSKRNPFRIGTKTPLYLPFVRIDTGDWKLPRVLNLVFSVCSYILVFR